MKLNHKLQLIAVFMGMLMLTACGGGNDSKPVTPPPPPPVSQSLDGLWSTRCSASNNLAGYDEQDTFNFKGNTLTTTKFFTSRILIANIAMKCFARVLRPVLRSVKR